MEGENKARNYTRALLPRLSPSLLELQHNKEKQQTFLQEAAGNYLPQSLGCEYVCCVLIILAFLFHKKINPQQGDGMERRKPNITYAPY